MITERTSPVRVAVVGACASGKSTLVDALRIAGYEARHVAQEHSYVPSMWSKISQPDVLLYLDVNFANVQARRPDPSFHPQDLAEQERRLIHARANCDLYLDTNRFLPDDVRKKSLEFLERLSKIDG
jgi:hypothetical protein